MPRDKCPIEAEISSILKDAGERTRVDIAMAYLTRPRIRKLILKLKEKRCRVRILLSDEYQNRKTTVPMLTGGKVPLKVIENEHYNKEIYWLGGEKQCRDNWRGRMHHKFVLIEHDQNQIVWTGSYNLTHPGLRYNDETVLRINDAGTYRRYKHQFEVLFKNDRALKKRITL
jgi:phosphatidylserine/phosphatidylglycerophosphate/cardiolipin synthase-like enzyme